MGYPGGGWMGGGFPQQQVMNMQQQPQPGWPGYAGGTMQRTSSNMSINMDMNHPGYYPNSGQGFGFPGNFQGSMSSMNPNSCMSMLNLNPAMNPGMGGTLPYNQRFPHRPASPTRSTRSRKTRTKSHADHSSSRGRRSHYSSDSSSYSAGSEDSDKDDKKTFKPTPAPPPPQVVAKPKQPEPVVAIRQEGSWECEHCTYRNPTALKVCSMCSKSKRNKSNRFKNRHNRERRKTIDINPSELSGVIKDEMTDITTPPIRRASIGGERSSSDCDLSEPGETEVKSNLTFNIKPKQAAKTIKQTLEQTKVQCNDRSSSDELDKHFEKNIRISTTESSHSSSDINPPEASPAPQRSHKAASPHPTAAKSKKQISPKKQSQNTSTGTGRYVQSIYYPTTDRKKNNTKILLMPKIYSYRRIISEFQRKI